MNNYNLQDWLNEDEQNMPDFMQGFNNQQSQGFDDNQGMPPEPQQDQPQQPQQEPQMPNDQVEPQEPPSADLEDDDIEQDFEIWKKNYFKETLKQDPQLLLDYIRSVRGNNDLSSSQRKFIYDNYGIQLIRNSADISKISKQIRRDIKDQLDKNNPGVSLVNHIMRNLEGFPQLYETFMKMQGYEAMKGELHRKFIASLTNSVQVTSGFDKENLILNETEFSIPISTRFLNEWGEVPIGFWSLHEDDPNKYLSEPEVNKLTDGSPEERDVLRHRIIIESIAESFENNTFLINSVKRDGTIQMVGLDLGNALKGAYAQGKIIVKSRKSDNSEAVLDENGALVPMYDLSIKFVDETGQMNADGYPEKREYDFIERRNGLLILAASDNTLKKAGSKMQGIIYKDVPYNGNPADIDKLRNCNFTAYELLMRQC